MNTLKSLIIDVMRLIDDIPYAISLLRKQGIGTFFSRLILYLKGVRIPAATPPEDQAFRKKIIYCFDEMADPENPSPFEIPKKLQFIYGYETAVLAFGNFRFSRLIPKFWFFRFYPNQGAVDRKLLNDLRYLAGKSFRFALCNGTPGEAITQAFHEAGISILILTGDVEPLVNQLLKLFKAEPAGVVLPHTEVVQMLEKSQLVKRNKSEIAVILHLYYVELWDEICHYLRNIPVPFDLYLSLNPSVSAATVAKISGAFPGTRLYIFENRGRDVFAFLQIFTAILRDGYTCVCKIHSKQSPHFQDSSGKQWRDAVFESLLGSKETVKEIIRHFAANPSAGIIAASDYLFRYQDPMNINGPAIQDFAARLNIPFLRKFYYPAGTMFWFRPQALQKLAELNLHPEDFPEELSPLVSCVDGTAADGVERLVALVALAEGFRVQDTKSVKS